MRGVLVLIRLHKQYSIPHKRKYLLAFVPPMATRVNLHHFSSVCFLFPLLSLSLPLLSKLTSFSGLMVKIVLIRGQGISVTRACILVATVVMTNKRPSMRTSQHVIRVPCIHDTRQTPRRSVARRRLSLLASFPPFSRDDWLKLCSAKNY